MPELVAIGQVVKPQGRKGEVVVHPLTDRPGRFEGLRSAFVGRGSSARLVSVEWSWPHKGRYVVKLAGVDSIDEAETYRGLDVSIPESDLATLPDGSYYHHQLTGLRVVNREGASLGTVTGLLETGAVPVLVVRSPGREILIPLSDGFVHEVDLAAGVMTASEPEMVDVED